MFEENYDGGQVIFPVQFHERLAHQSYILLFCRNPLHGPDIMSAVKH